MSGQRLCRLCAGGRADNYLHLAVGKYLKGVVERRGRSVAARADFRGGA